VDSAATLVWLAPEPPDAAQARALASWSRARGVPLTSPVHAEVPALAVDLGMGDAVERWLDIARDAIAGRERDSADRALSSAESLLRAHPEWPQAAWLMAELDRARSVEWRHVPPTDLQFAEGAWLRAEAIDGGRVAGVGEEASARHPSSATIAVDLTPEDAELWLDGQPAKDTVIPTRAGTHALVATWGGAPVWAEWIEVPAGSSSVRVKAPGVLPCSVRDVARAHVTADPTGAPGALQIDAGHVDCRAWVAATAGTGPGSLRMALCETNRCGPALEWRAPEPWTWSPDDERRNERKGMPWATWGLVGTGVAIAAGVVILASGALRPVPAETHFVSGGIKRQ